MQVTIRPGTFVRTIMEDATGDRHFTPWINAKYPAGIENVMRSRTIAWGWRPLYRLRVTIHPQEPK